MKATNSSSGREPIGQARPEPEQKGNILSSFRGISTAGLLLLSGGSLKESTLPSSSAEVSSEPTPASLVVPPPAIDDASYRQPPLSTKGEARQIMCGERPSDLVQRQALLKIRAYLGEVMSDTQSVEIELGRLRDGYSARDEVKQLQQEIISIVARHASTTPEAIAKQIAAKMQEDQEHSPLTSRHRELRSAQVKYRQSQGELEEKIYLKRAEMEQAIVDSKLDKIESSLSLLRELKSLMEAEQSGGQHDIKRLKLLRRMCGSESLEEVIVHISGLERYQNLVNPTLQKEQSSKKEEIVRLEAKMVENEEAFNREWCENYERRNSALEELSRLEATMREVKAGGYSTSPREIGHLMNSSNHPAFKMDLAALLLRDCSLTVHTLRDQAKERAATICQQGRPYGGFLGTGEHYQLVSIGINEANTRIRIKASKDGVALASCDGASFESEILDIAATAGSQLDGKFTPSFSAGPTHAEIPITAKNVKFTTMMNPGGILDLTDNGRDTTETSFDVTLEGSGIILVGEQSSLASPIPVEVVGTMQGEAPLLISLPDRLTLNELTMTSASISEFSLAAGNAKFTIRKKDFDGYATNVDVELNTPRGRQVIAIIRDGENVLSLRERP